MDSIKQVLMRRDGISANEADELIAEARADLADRIANGELPFDICADWFGLEPDYLDDLMG